ncbi:MAG: chorismate synthase [Tidjanibacter sp.]|nr:chorismate synthase [Tidjanibacter sp.]
MNRFSAGGSFGITVFGESHGEMIGVVVDGVPAGIPLTEADFETDLARRRSGAKGTTPRTESDTPHLVSGIYNGHTTGAPLAIVFYNNNTRSSDYEDLQSTPRPSHADRVAGVKFGGWNDPRGGGHFSGRLTLTLVAAGVVAKKIIGDKVKFDTRISQIGTETDSAKFEAVIAAALADGDSVGGRVECSVSGVPTGIGEPFFNSVESVASHLLFSVPAVKGVSFGAGFDVVSRRGSENNDPIINPDGTTATNNDGGINGGISNGNPICVSVAFKPTASISKKQEFIHLDSGEREIKSIKGRHDACIALRGAVVVESVMAITLASLGLKA